MLITVAGFAKRFLTGRIFTGVRLETIVLHLVDFIGVFVRTHLGAEGAYEFFQIHIHI